MVKQGREKESKKERELKEGGLGPNLISASRFSLPAVANPWPNRLASIQLVLLCGW